MLTCPACGDPLDDDETADLDLEDELECPRCRRAWVIAALEPLELTPSERELGFTD
jgi:uncharacterized protein YbaR (Trm112 family)